MIKYIYLFALLLIAQNLSAQNDVRKFDEDELVQFTGIILTPDSLKAVPNVNIRIKGTNSGAISNDEGFFSLVALKGDTLLFTAVGVKPERYIVPKNLSGKKYTMIQTMSEDTIYLTEAIVKPYISRELFQHYFVTLELPEDGMTINSLDPETIRQYAALMAMDGSENQKYAMRQESGKYYYAGQMPPINLLNPFAWAQFIKSWKEGKLKRQP